MEKYVYNKNFKGVMLNEGREKDEAKLEMFGVTWSDVDDLKASSVVCKFCWVNC